MGLTTWAETSDVNETRSDCHAWGSSPNIEFFRIILGINSDAPEFSKVRIEPHLSDIHEIGGEIPHTNGKLKVHYRMEIDHLQATIVMPSNTKGMFVWNVKTYELHEGENMLFL
ncbi:MAG: hypothetical protein JXB49_05125 [Bacteroidales bacterium]|nr:hypothetical protein [Bacteroidales bacterium]